MTTNPSKYKIIPLNNGEKVIVDKEDFEWLSKYNWTARYQRTSRKYYVVTYSIEPSEYMHTMIIGKKEGKQIDHINGDGLDNRRCNLRHSTVSQNQLNRGKTKNNTTGFKGVIVCTPNKSWRAQISYKHIHYDMGLFFSKEDAARAYDKKAVELCGEFAVTNEKLGLLRHQVLDTMGVEQ